MPKSVPRYRLTEKGWMQSHPETREEWTQYEEITFGLANPRFRNKPASFNQLCHYFDDWYKVGTKIEPKKLKKYLDELVNKGLVEEV